MPNWNAIYILDKNINKFISRYLRGESALSIANQLKIDPRTVIKRLKIKGVFRGIRKHNYRCSAPSCSKKTEKDGRKYCRGCRERSEKNGVCEGCSTPLRIKYESTILGKILVLLCDNCSREWEVINPQ